MNTRVLDPWIKTIEKHTGGKLKIKIYPGSTLGKPQAQYDMAQRGVADITWGLLGYTPGRFPLATVMELPFISPSAEIGSRMVQRLYDMGYLKSEFSNVKLLALGMPPNMDLHTNKKLVKTLADLKGMKIRTPSALMGKVIKLWGGVPVPLPAPEIYLALERGVIDAVLLDPLTLMGVRANEVTKYHTKIGVSAPVFFFAMNQKTWVQLPPDIQKVIDKFSGEYWGADINGVIAHRASLGVLKKLEQTGHTVYSLPQAELQRWQEAAVPVFDEWVKDMEARGFSGSAVLRETRHLKAELAKAH
jgi:TRAP-type C4-dicarboxylate transport system substrate-binding protein